MPALEPFGYVMAILQLENDPTGYLAPKRSCDAHDALAPWLVPIRDEMTSRPFSAPLNSANHGAFAPPAFLGLRWSDVDFESGTLRIRYALQRIKSRNTETESAGDSKVSTKRGERSAFHLVEPKTKQSRRTIAMPKLTLSALAEHKDRQSQERLLAGSAWRVPVLTCEGEQVAVDDLVFITRFGNPFDAPTVTHRFQALLPQAGIGHHRFHDLRHTAATLLAVQGVHPRAIQAALGWENLSMLNRYAHFVEEQRHAVAAAMDSILTPVAVNVAVKGSDAKLN
jgi:integrase